MLQLYYGNYLIRQFAKAVKVAVALLKGTDTRKSNRHGPAFGPILMKMFNKMLKKYSFGIRIQISLGNWGKGGKIQH